MSSNTHKEVVVLAPKRGGSEGWDVSPDESTSVGMTAIAFMNMGPTLIALVHKYSKIVRF